MARRIKPRMGDALIVGFEAKQVGNATWAALAACECGEKEYSAVSFSQESARGLIARKHVQHLGTCVRQRQLFALD